MYSTLEPEVLLNIITDCSNIFTYNLTQPTLEYTSAPIIQSINWDVLEKNLVITFYDGINIDNISKPINESNNYIIYQDSTLNNIYCDNAYCVVSNLRCSDLDDCGENIGTLINLNMSDEYFYPDLRIYTNAISNDEVSFDINAVLYPLGYKWESGQNYNIKNVSNPDSTNIFNNTLLTVPVKYAYLTIDNIKVNDQSGTNYHVLSYTIIYNDNTESNNVVKINSEGWPGIGIELHGANSYRWANISCNSPVQLLFNSLSEDCTLIQSYLSTSYNYVDISYSYIQ